MPLNINERFSRRLETVCKEKKIHQKQFRGVGINPSSMSRLKTGAYKWRLDQVAAIARMLGSDKLSEFFQDLGL
jgi:predicted transcriptional regulator